MDKKRLMLTMSPSSSAGLPACRHQPCSHRKVRGGPATRFENSGASEREEASRLRQEDAVL
ncbi:Alcohol dehydrogenase transcription factor Myb/SANT-like [Musa troglodytarum]|uniref:Alcohol dehydrogenase transcription factor Myb/SANT-like n=1 Tax=Musa troglodytarum TaxID=320322 RepID=A0A9E7F0R0_9LILI|nr:Alcohol dehydrogenase transcription factor Myb/SANT-like [Musa troglodytarum]